MGTPLVEREIGFDVDETETPKSKNIKQYGYRGSDESLVVEFVHGGIYEYPGLPYELFQEMRAADSPARFFHARIKNQYRALRVVSVQKQKGAEVA
jgi:hypothetical protein